MPLSRYLRRHLRFLPLWVVVEDGDDPERVSIGIRHILPTRGLTHLLREFRHQLKLLQLVSVLASPPPPSPSICGVLCASQMHGSCAEGTLCPCIHITREGWYGRRPHTTTPTPSRKTVHPQPHRRTHVTPTDGQSPMLLSDWARGCTTHRPYLFL